MYSVKWFFGHIVKNSRVQKEKPNKLIRYFILSGLFFISCFYFSQLQLRVSRADIWSTYVDNDCVLYYHGTCFMGQSVNWRAHSTPNRINKIEEEGLYCTFSPCICHVSKTIQLLMCREGKMWELEEINLFSTRSGDITFFENSSHHELYFNGT